MSIQRVVILGRGGAGKSTVARRLGEAFGLPVIELDKHFWQPGLVPLPKDQWVKVQEELTNQACWVMDGDLGPYDVLPVRLSAADTVLLLDFPMWLCLVADPPSGQRKVGLLVVADYLGMAGTTENRSPARRSPNLRDAYVSLAKGTRPVSVQVRAGVMDGRTALVLDFNRRDALKPKTLQRPGL